MGLLEPQTKADQQELEQRAELILKAIINAANADGQIDQKEIQRIAGKLQEAGADAKTAGAVTINYGLFLNAVTSFLIAAFAVFMLVRSINMVRRQEESPPVEPPTKECPCCCMAIAIKATRCPQCTSELKLE